MSEAVVPSWIIIALSSAVVSAVINSISNVWIKHVDRNREDDREAKRVKHVYFEVATQLEVFAYQCSGRIDDLNNAISEAQDQHSNPFNRLRSVTMQFNPEPAWLDLPIEFVAKVKPLSRHFNVADERIMLMGEWLDSFDQAELDRGRLAYYGRHACLLAVEIRTKIGVDEGDVPGYLTKFQKVLDSIERQYRERPDIDLIPELKTQFDTASVRV